MLKTKLSLIVMKISFITLVVFLSACAPNPFVTTPVPTTIVIPTVVPTSTQNWPATSTANDHQADAEFENLAARVKAQESDIDFTELRMAFARTSQYDPYGFQYRQLRDEMVAASDAGDFENALELANKFLSINFIFPEAHIIAVRAYDKLNKPDEADFHRYVLNGLIESILTSGDGTTPQSAYKIVLIEEEYLILEVKEIKDPVNREEFVEGCDAFDGIDSNSGQMITVYFNPRIPIQSSFILCPTIMVEMRGRVVVKWPPPNTACTGRWGASRARFISSFLATSFFCSQTESAPAPAPVPQTVGR